MITVTPARRQLFHFNSIVCPCLLLSISLHAASPADNRPSGQPDNTSEVLEYINKYVLKDYDQFVAAMDEYVTNMEEFYTILHNFSTSSKGLNDSMAEIIDSGTIQKLGDLAHFLYREALHLNNMLLHLPRLFGHLDEYHRQGVGECQSTG